MMGKERNTAGAYSCSTIIMLLMCRIDYMQYTFIPSVRAGRIYMLQVYKYTCLHKKSTFSWSTIVIVHKNIQYVRLM